MTRDRTHVPLLERARRHAALHSESAEIIGELITRVEGVEATIRRLAPGHDWSDDLDPDT